MLTIILSGATWIWVKVRKVFADASAKEWLAIGGLLVLAVLIIIAFRSCRSEPVPKLDSKEIIEAQQAIAAHDDKKLAEVLAINEAREAAADAVVDEAKKIQIETTQAARKKWQNATFEEKLAEYNRRKAAGQ